MDRGSPVHASVATSSVERGFAARAAVVLDAIIRHGGPAGYSAGTVRSGGLPASRAALVRDAHERCDAIPEGCTPGSACDRRVAAGATAPHERSGAPGQDAARSALAVSCRPTSRSVRSSGRQTSRARRRLRGSHMVHAGAYVRPGSASFHSARVSVRPATAQARCAHADGRASQRMARPALVIARR